MPADQTYRRRSASSTVGALASGDHNFDDRELHVCAVRASTGDIGTPLVHAPPLPATRDVRRVGLPTADEEVDHA
jgi:hypothetical protein